VLLSAVGAGDADEPAWAPRRRASRTCAGCEGDGREGNGEWIMCGGGGPETSETSSDDAERDAAEWAVAMVVGAKLETVQVAATNSRKIIQQLRLARLGRREHRTQDACSPRVPKHVSNPFLVQVEKVLIIIVTTIEKLEAAQVRLPIVRLNSWSSLPQ
jgi:hypothetical protein